VTRFDPSHPNGVPLPDVTTAADGSFSLTDTPPKPKVHEHKVPAYTVCYQVSHAADAHLSASAASVSVAISNNGR
jgi:hypothetical protein